MALMVNPKNFKPITLHDVALQAGVSVMTVSRALANPAVVSKVTLERVKQAIEETGYIPNMLAGGLKSRKSKTVVGLVPIISVPQFLPTIRTLTDCLNDAGYQFILGQTGYDHSREEALINAMLGRQPDALVIAGLIHSDSVRAKLKKNQIPVVETWDLSADPLDMQVGFSHDDVGTAVGKYFLAKGWKKIGIATASDERAMQRCHAFQKTIGKKVPASVMAPPSNLAAGRNALAELLTQEPHLDAVYCSSDGLAHGILVEATARGLRVPEDLSICGFGDADFAAHLHPSLTTVRIDGSLIGQTAAQLIIDRCQGKPVSEKVVKIGFSIVERGSTQFQKSLPKHSRRKAA